MAEVAKNLLTRGAHDVARDAGDSTRRFRVFGVLGIFTAIREGDGAIRVSVGFNKRVPGSGPGGDVGVVGLHNNRPLALELFEYRIPFNRLLNRLSNIYDIKDANTPEDLYSQALLTLGGQIGQK